MTQTNLHNFNIKCNNLSKKVIYQDNGIDLFLFTQLPNESIAHEKESVVHDL